MKRLGSKIIAEYAKIRKRIRELWIIDNPSKEQINEMDDLVDKAQDYQDKYPDIHKIIDYEGNNINVS